MTTDSSTRQAGPAKNMDGWLVFHVFSSFSFAREYTYIHVHSLDRRADLTHKLGSKVDQGLIYIRDPLKNRVYYLRTSEQIFLATG